MVHSMQRIGGGKQRSELGKIRTIHTARNETTSGVHGEEEEVGAQLQGKLLGMEELRNGGVSGDRLERKAWAAAFARRFSWKQDYQTRCFSRARFCLQLLWRKARLESKRFEGKLFQTGPILPSVRYSQIVA